MIVEKINILILMKKILNGLLFAMEPRIRIVQIMALLWKNA